MTTRAWSQISIQEIDAKTTKVKLYDPITKTDLDGTIQNMSDHVYFLQTSSIRSLSIHWRLEGTNIVWSESKRMPTAPVGVAAAASTVEHKRSAAAAAPTGACYKFWLGQPCSRGVKCHFKHISKKED